MPTDTTNRKNVQVAPLETYDRAVRKFCRCTVGPNNEAVPIIFATPRKEFATQRYVNPDNELAEANPEYENTVPYPVMSVTRLNPVWDSTRFTPLNQRRLQLSADRKIWLQQRYPVPYDIEYQVDLRSITRDHLNQMLMQMTLKMDKPLVALKVDFGSPYGMKNVFIGINGIVDNSILEQDELDKERILRGTVTMNLKGWLFHKITKTPSAIRLYSDFYLANTADNLETFDVSEETPETTLIEDGEVILKEEEETE